MNNDSYRGLDTVIKPYRLHPRAVIGYGFNGIAHCSVCATRDGYIPLDHSIIGMQDQIDEDSILMCDVCGSALADTAMQDQIDRDVYHVCYALHRDEDLGIAISEGYAHARNHGATHDQAAHARAYYLARVAAWSAYAGG